MSTTLKQLLAEQAELEKKISEVRMAEKSEALSKINSLIQEHGLTQDDIFGRTSSAKTRKTSGTKVAPKYRNPATGETWSARGRTPKWLEGKNRDDFLIV